MSKANAVFVFYVDCGLLIKDIRQGNPDLGTFGVWIDQSRPLTVSN